MMDYYPTNKPRPRLLKVYTVKHPGRKRYSVAAYSLAEAFHQFGAAGIPELVQHISRIYPVSASNINRLAAFGSIIAEPGKVYREDSGGRWVPYNAL